MFRSFPRVFLFLLPFLLFSASPEKEAERALSAMKNGGIGFCGDNGIFYHRAELEHLAAGPLTASRMPEISKSRRQQGADPVPAIASFAAGLKKQGIQLILVPIPPKCSIYPFGSLKEGDASIHLQELFDRLEKHGVTVLDMTPVFLQKKQNGKKLYCFTDSHWAPDGILASAKQTAQLIGPLSGTKQTFSVARHEITIAGDLLPQNSKERERLVLYTVTGNVFSETSPVLVLGDSHTLVFSTKEDRMHADRSGFCELLAAELGHPVERMGTLGSASTTPRVQLFRKAAAEPGWLKGKKAVVWCFAARELTESANGWIKVPVIR